MPLNPIVSICGIALALASVSAIAAPEQMSEQLSNWQRPETATIQTIVADPQVPLALQASANIGQSIIRELVLLKGHAMLGTRYAFGSNDADAVDCSALIQQLFQNAGIELPRTTHELANFGEPVDIASLQPGDLLFYRWKKHGLHVAVYAGDGLVIHASPGERSVVMTELNETWDHHFVAARRVLSENNS